MEQNKFSNEAPEQVILIPSPRTIRINPAYSERAYGLFDTKTGTQVTDFVKGNGEQIEFNNLNPDMHYDVGVIENPGDVKPQYALIWANEMRDVTDDILNNSDNLPVEYPRTYTIRYKDGNGTYDLIDDKGETVGQVMNLSQTGDKPRFVYICTLKIKDDTKN